MLNNQPGESAAVPKRASANAVARSAPAQSSAGAVAREGNDIPALRDAGPAIDLDAAFKLAREVGRSRAGLVTQDLPSLAPASVEFETPLGRAIAKAARPDCRTEYAGLGLLALPFLLRDAVTNSGCTW